jgi:hypothetical protein
MVRTIVILLVVVLADFSVLFGQDISEQKKTVAFVFGTVHPRNSDGTPMKTADGKPLAIEQPLGTAFFVLYPDLRGGPDYGFMYLVTAKHVLKDADGRFLKDIKLRVNLKDGSRAVFITGIPVSDSNGKLTWFQDTNDAVDVAAIPLLPDQHKVDFKAIPRALFVDGATITSQKVTEGDALYFIGLMTQYYGESKNYPVVRRGTLALMTDEQIETPTGLQKAFIAELASWPGNSGSTVFLSLSGLRQGGLALGTNLKFLGILSGSFLNKFKGTMLEATVVEGNDLNTGISFIVPAASVEAVLDSAAAQGSRDAQIQAQQAPH